MPNSNCLDGFQCPNCSSYGPFHIEVKTTMLFDDDGCIDDAGDKEWSNDSFCQCDNCNHSGVVATFTIGGR